MGRFAFASSPEIYVLIPVILTSMLQIHTVVVCSTAPVAKLYHVGALSGTQGDLRRVMHRSWGAGFVTATQAAATGGITTLVDMPLNSMPCTVTAELLKAKIAAAKVGSAQ